MEGLHVVAATPERWDDTVRLFSPRGSHDGCWCVWHRLTGREAECGARDGGARNRQRLQALVEGGRVPGLLAYRADEPVGWVALAPRYEYGRVQRSALGRHSAPDGTWAIVCFLVAHAHRGQGIARALLGEAVSYAAAQGALAVEAYPVDTSVRGVDAADAYHGVASTFERAGFQEVARPFPARPVMRLALSRGQRVGKGAADGVQFRR